MCLAELVPDGALTEGPFRAVEVAGPLAFEAVGVMAEILTPLVPAGHQRPGPLDLRHRLGPRPRATRSRSPSRCGARPGSSSRRRSSPVGAARERHCGTGVPSRGRHGRAQGAPEPVTSRSSSTTVPTTTSPRSSRATGSRRPPSRGRARSCRRPRRRGLPQLRWRQRLHRSPQGSRTPTAPPSSWPRPSVQRADVVVCSTGLIGEFLPMDRIGAGCPAHRRASLDDRWGRAPRRRDHDDRLRAEAGRRSPATAGPSAAWPRAPACSLPASRRCSASSRPTPSPTPADLDAALRAATVAHLRPGRLRRLHVDQRHRGAHGLRRLGSRPWTRRPHRRA